MAMNEPEVFEYSPKMPDPQSFDSSEMVVRYNRATDTLIVHLYGTGRPAVSVLQGDYLYVRVDPETNDVIGFQIENYLHEAVLDEPRLLAVAQLVGITDEEIAEVRSRIDPIKLRESTLELLLSELATRSGR